MELSRDQRLYGLRAGLAVSVAYPFAHGSDQGMPRDLGQVARRLDQLRRSAGFVEEAP